MNWNPHLLALSDTSTEVDSIVTPVDEYSDMSESEENLYHHTDLVFYSLGFLKEVGNIFSAIIHRDLQYEESTSNPPNWPWFAYPVKLSQERTGLNQKQQMLGLKQLKRLEMIQIKYEGIPKRRFIMLS